MNFTFIGLGYVGLVNSVLLASFYHNVIGYDIDKEKISLLKAGAATIDEPNLQTLLKEARKCLRFTSNAKDAIRPNDIIVICVDTPINKETGEIDMSHYFMALDDIAENAIQDTHIIIKSTVPVGTNKMTKEYLESHSSYKFSVLSMPEFMSEGTAVYDTINPYRLVFGVTNQEAIEFAQSIAPAFLAKKVPVLITSPENAELIKLSSDAFIATKLSFMNSLARICDEVGGDIDRVSLGLSLDPRIGNSFTRPGIGYGGNLIDNLDVSNWVFDKKNLSFPIVEEARKVNDSQVKYFLDLVSSKFKSVNKLTIGVLGASYKGDSEDIRNSPAIKIIRSFLDRGADVKLYDPYSVDNARKALSRHTHITYVDYPKEAMEKVDFLVILSDHSEFKTLSQDDFINNMKKPIIFDGRNIFKKKDMADVEYYSIGRGR